MMRGLLLVLIGWPARLFGRFSARLLRLLSWPTVILLNGAGAREPAQPTTPEPVLVPTWLLALLDRDEDLPHRLRREELVARRRNLAVDGTSADFDRAQRMNDLRRQLLELQSTIAELKANLQRLYKESNYNQAREIDRRRFESMDGLRRCIEEARSALAGGPAAPQRPAVEGVPVAVVQGAHEHNVVVAQ